MHLILCISSYVSPSMHLILCISFYASHSMHLILCISFYASPSMHLCISFYKFYIVVYFLLLLKLVVDISVT